MVIKEFLLILYIVNEVMMKIRLFIIGLMVLILIVILMLNEVSKLNILSILIN